MKRIASPSAVKPSQPALLRLQCLNRSTGSPDLARYFRPTLMACLMPIACCALLSIGIFVSASESVPQSSQHDTAVPDDAAGSQIQHGPVEVLSELLLRDRQSEMAMSEIIGDRQQRRMLNHRRLQQIFAQSTDCLQLDRRTGSVTNTRQMAMDMLKLASREEQAQWKVAHEEFARAVLERATSLEDFLSVEQQFPLTEAGMKAGLTAVTMLHLSGLTEYASARLQLLESSTEATILEPDYLTLSAPVRKAIDRSLRRPNRPTEDASKGTHRALATTQMNLSSIADVPTIAAVWPKPIWNWTELIEDFPDAPQPATTNALLPFLRSHEFNLGDFNNWRPVLTKDCLIHRTPMRIVAFDQSSGKELWTLITNTVQRPSSRAPATGRMNVPMSSEDHQRQVEGVLSIRDLQAFGLMSSDQSYLYFLDGIPLVNAAFERSGVLAEIRFGLIPPERTIGLPTRLVALKLNGPRLPQVAWIAGSPVEFGSESGQTFEYRVQETLESTNAVNASGTDVILSGSESPPKSSETTQQLRKTAELSATGSVPASSISTGVTGTPLSDSGPANVDAGEVMTLDQHSFLSPPIGFADQLFVMTEFNQQTYVSSLSKTKGRILWQRPLSHTGRREWTLRQTPPRGSCVMSRGVLVCVLHDGLALGVRPADGQLLWATAFTEPGTSERAAGLFRGVMPPPSESIEMSVTPVANSSLVVVMHPGSWHVVGIEAETGNIRWQVSRSAIGMTAIDGQLDQYIAGVTESKVVMIGKNHCRALDVMTGEQLWTSEIAESCGRVEVSEDRCLIPQENGQLLTVDLKSGHVHRPRYRFLPELADQPWGAIASTENRLFAVTPVSVTSFVRCDAALENDDLLDSLKDDETILTRARLLLLNQQEEEAIAILQREASKSVSDASAQDLETQEDYLKSGERMRTRQGIVDRTLAEVILQKWADLYVTAMTESRTIDGFGMNESVSEPDVSQDIPGTPETRQQLQEFGASDIAMLLGELDLDSDQQLRAAVMALLSRPDFALQADDLAELEEFKEWSQALPLTDDWTVRPDLLLSGFIHSPQPLPDDLETAGMMTCRLLAVRSILFPKVFADEDRTEKLVRRLVELEEYAAAESVLLVWKRSCPSDRAASLLTSLQTHGIIRPATISDVGTSSVRGLTTTAISGRRLRFDVTDSMESTTTGLLLNALDHVKYPRGSVLPERIPYDLLLVRTLDETYQLNFAARRDGAIVSSLPLMPGPNDFFQWFSPSVYRDAQPSLLPLVGQESIMMIDCTQPGKPTVLWNRANLAAGVAGQLNEYIEFGPLGAEFMVWHADGILHCTHPLTGEDLWSRRMHLKGGEVYIQGIRRIFGDEEVIVVLNADSTQFERYRTRDGQLLGVGVIQPGPDCDAITMGRFLVYCDSKGRICVFDGRTGRNRFAGSDAVFRLTNVVPRTFYALSDNRVLTVTKDNEVLVIDVVSGQIQCRLSVQPHLVGDEIFAYTAFEQNGRLYVGVEDELDMHRASSDDLSDDFPQIRFGIMFCVDPANGRLVWNQRVQNLKFVVPSGDPTDVLIALQDRSFQDPHERYRRSSIHVTLINGITGEQIVEESVSSRFPSRITHHAADGIIELRAKETQTKISIELTSVEPDDVSRPANGKSSEHDSGKKAD